MRNVFEGRDRFEVIALKYPRIIVKARRCFETASGGRWSISDPFGL